MGSIHTFRDEAGELRVYPLWVADAKGYEIILWNDWSEDEKVRREARAERDFHQKRDQAGLPLDACERITIPDRRGLLVRVFATEKAPVDA